MRAARAVEAVLAHARGEVHGHLLRPGHPPERRLRPHGVAARPETAKAARGRCQAIYLDLELGGFAVHLLQA